MGKPIDRNERIRVRNANILHKQKLRDFIGDKITPGEWDHAADTLRSNACVYSNLKMPGGDYLHTIAAKITNWKDARLMSAAPQLLAAVKVMMVALAGEPGALSADARTAIAIATKAVRKATDNPSRPADAGGRALLYAEEMQQALEQILAYVTGGCDEDDRDAIEEECRGTLARVMCVDYDDVTTPGVEEIKVAMLDNAEAE